jgi:hypothetical protein
MMTPPRLRCTFGPMERMTRVFRAGDHPELLSDGLLALALTVFAQLNLRFSIDQSVHYGPRFAAEDLLDRSPELARPPLRAVQETGRQAVAELGRMLGLLRGRQAELALKPQPGTAQLSELAEHMSQTGLPVVLQVEGTPGRSRPASN